MFALGAHPLVRSLMSYKTILVHVDRSPHAPARIAIAAALAASHGAHLVGAAMTGISRWVYQDSSIDLARTVLANEIELLSREAEEALAQFDAMAAAAGVLSFERRLVDDDPASALALQGRCADLVVMSQEDADDALDRVYPALPPYVLLHCARPVLVLPFAGSHADCGKHPLIAWDGSMAASRAVANALPVLRRAHTVSLAMFNVQPEPGEPGADIARYLARHDVNVELLAERTENDVGEALLTLAADRNADLIVLGGYGHARFREILLGGVTRSILKSMTVPVLMSH